MVGAILDRRCGTGGLAVGWKWCGTRVADEREQHPLLPSGGGEVGVLPAFAVRAPAMRPVGGAYREVVTDPAPRPADAVTARTWLATFLLGMCALVGLYSTQPVLASIARWAAVPEAQAAWTVGATTLGVAAMAPIAGAVSDRVGRKRVILGAITVLLVATALCATAGSFGALLAFRFLQGLATPFVFAVAVAFIGDEFSGATAGRLNAVYVAGTAFGGFAGRLLPGLAADASHDWRASFLPLDVLLAAALTATLLWLPRETRFVPSPSFGAGLRGVGAHLRDPRLLATCAVGAALLFQQVASFTFVSLHLQRPPLQLTPVQVGLVFVVFLVPTLVTPQVGRAVARFGRARTFAAAATLGAAGMLLTLVPSVPAVVAGLACSCVAVFAGQACATGFLGTHARTHRSAAVGLYLTAYYLGGTVGGVVPAPLYAAAGWRAVVLLIVPVIATAAVVGAIAWRRTVGGAFLR